MDGCEQRKKGRKIGRFHVLTDTALQKRYTHIELAEMAISGGADTIQFREKRGSTRELIDVALKLKEVCSKAGAVFIVNDRVDVAIASSADGVHLGQKDFPISLARKILGDDAIIGGSATNLEEARFCLMEGADYIGFGPVFPTASKEDAAPAKGLRLLKEVVETIPLPVIAIGGINIENMDDVLKTGVYGIAVISAVCCHEDPLYAARIMKEKMAF
ncbi:MAG: thiamine phosphate synthase [Syntrophorhabdaceae bacterium]|nr:thiamine phosphate synthase [Syntrophorhabdaceae bacterium]